MVPRSASVSLSAKKTSVPMIGPSRVPIPPITTMKITNVNPVNGKMISSVYMIPRRDNEDDILVTGSHLIYDKSLKRFVYVRDYSKSIKTKRRLEVVYCLITDNHTIPISDYIFHDWEDTPNKSKDILCI